MRQILHNATELIGNTPLLRLERFSAKAGCRAPIYAKLELCNPSGSVKDRSAWYMLRRAMERGEVGENTVIIEPTAGNSAVSLAAVCAALGLRLILVVSDDLPAKKLAHLKVYGAQVRTFPAKEGMAGAQALVQNLRQGIPDSFIPSQFENEDACLAHREGTAAEILQVLPSVDYFVAGSGTGATVTGVGELLKMHCPDCRVIAVEPVDSPVLSGGFPGAHSLQGIGPGFVPQILNAYILDEVIRVRTPDSLDMVRLLAATEGLLCGLSSGAALTAAVSVAQRPEAEGKIILTVLPDTGERYLEQL